MTPRIEWACHPVAYMSSWILAPLGSLSKATSWDCLVLGDSGVAGAGLSKGAIGPTPFVFAALMAFFWGAFKDFFMG